MTCLGKSGHEKLVLAMMCAKQLRSEDGWADKELGFDKQELGWTDKELGWTDKELGLNTNGCVKPAAPRNGTAEDHPWLKT
eukprot:1157831-Pelagomonas_calceolata.AAC.2